MMISNIESVAGKRIVKHLGLVQGSSVRARQVSRVIMENVRKILGGELEDYTELLKDSREDATEIMIKQAESVGANAILNVRFSTSSITAGSVESFVYGTAVTIEDENA